MSLRDFDDDSQRREPRPAHPQAWRHPAGSPEPGCGWGCAALIFALLGVCFFAGVVLAFFVR